MRSILVLSALLFSLPALAQQPTPPAPQQPQTTQPQQNCRSAKTGKFVSTKFARKHPKTTVCESK